MSEKTYFPSYLFFEINVSPLRPLIGPLLFSFHINAMNGEKSEYSVKISNCSDLNFELANKIREKITKYQNSTIHIIRICFDLKAEFRGIEESVAYGSTDYFTLLNETSNRYQNIAKEISNNYIRFLKYTSLVPSLVNITRFSNDLHKFIWLDKNKIAINGEPTDYSGQPAHVHANKDLDPIQYAIGSPRINHTTDRIAQLLLTGISEDILLELIVDAESALDSEPPRRAAIELASCCEIKIGMYITQTAFKSFQKNTKNSWGLGVIEQADQIFQKRHKRQFSCEFPQDFENILKLYKLRNSIVHRGELSYKLMNEDKVILSPEGGVSKIKGFKLSVLKYIDWISDNITEDNAF